MSMGLVVLIIWLLNITEHHSETRQTQTVCLRIVYAENAISQSFYFRFDSKRLTT